jgi:Fe2+ transport system protein FeoA
MSSAHLAFSSDGVRSIADLAEGAAGRVVGVTGADEERLDRLLALGVTAGAKVKVLQTFSGVVFLCDQTELVIERAVAEAIFIRLSHA